MSVKTRTAVVHTHYIEIEGDEFETTFSADEWIEPKVEREDGKTVITYASRDDYYPWSPVEDVEGIQWEEFRTEWDRDEFAREQLAAGWSVFVVDHFEHSVSVYTVLGPWEEQHEHRGIDLWDSRPSVILALRSEHFTDPAEAAASVAAEYTAWAQGEVYTLVREEYDAEGNLIETDSVGGYIGDDHAKQAIAEGAF